MPHILVHDLFRKEISESNCKRKNRSPDGKIDKKI